MSGIPFEFLKVVHKILTNISLPEKTNNLIIINQPSE